MNSETDLGPLPRVDRAIPRLRCVWPLANFGARHGPLSHHRSKLCMTTQPHSLWNRPFRPKSEFFGGPLTQGCALGYRKSALQALIANRRTAQTKHTPQRPPSPTGFVGNDKASAREHTANALPDCTRNDGRKRPCRPNVSRLPRQTGSRMDWRGARRCCPGVGMPPAVPCSGGAARQRRQRGQTAVGGMAGITRGKKSSPSILHRHNSPKNARFFNR